MGKNEFYIGWSRKAPEGYAGFIKKYLLVLGALVWVVAALVALGQKKFSTGNFEFGQTTEVKGIYFSTPVPCIKLPWLTMPLVGYGKHGADGILEGLGKEKGVASLEGKEVSLRGTLLYNGEKTIFQIDTNERPLLAVVEGGGTGSGRQGGAGSGAQGNAGSGRPAGVSLQTRDLGEATVRGEIVDSKCYFGVMKPGEGKPHRDCAIRCILGGIPPMLVVHNEKGEANYYLIVGPHGEKINTMVQGYVAEPVALRGRLVQMDDWIVLYVQEPQKIERLSYLQLKYGDKIAGCAADCRK